MSALANTAPLAANDQDELHAAATASLEGLIDRNMDVAVETVGAGEVLIERDNEAPEFISCELFAAQYSNNQGY